MGSLRGLRSGRHAVSLGSILAIAVLAGTCLTGCRSGSSGTASSWSMFGGSTKGGDKLAAAPPFEADATKPSTTATPYPTTSTPEGYVLAKANGPGAAAPAAPPGAEAVVYGAAPPVTATTTPESTIPDGYRTPATPGPASVAGADTPMSSIVPQVGPYAASTAAAPGTIDTASAPPPLDPLAQPGSPPAAFAASPGVSPPARVADARGAAGWGGNGSAGPPAEFGSAERYADESRYGGGSRFSGGPPASPQWQSSAPAPSGPPTDDGRQPVWPATSPSAAPFGAAPSVVPGPPAVPAAVPGGPVRRPDPGYRPGGTSSYRRVGDDDRAVVPASFDGQPR